MGTLGVLLALAGPWLLPTFMNAADPQAAGVVELGIVLLWIAAGYQIFDGLNLGSGFSLRGAGDVPRAGDPVLRAVVGRVRAAGAHRCRSRPDRAGSTSCRSSGSARPAAGSHCWSTCVLLGGALYLRWRSGAWRAIRI